MKIDRDQLLAEAVQRYKEGESVLMNKEAAALAVENQNERYQGDSWEEIINEYCEDKDKVSIGEIYEKALMINDRNQWIKSSEMRIVKILKHQGRVARRIRSGGTRVTYYCKP